MRNFFESTKPVDNNRKDQKKVIVEVGDGVAHAQAVHRDSSRPDFVQHFKNGEETVTNDAEEPAGEDLGEEFAPVEEIKAGLKQEILYDHNSTPLAKHPKLNQNDNIKTIKQNTPNKYERGNRRDIREFIGKA